MSSEGESKERQEMKNDNKRDKEDEKNEDEKKETLCRYAHNGAALATTARRSERTSIIGLCLNKL